MASSQNYSILSPFYQIIRVLLLNLVWTGIFFQIVIIFPSTSFPDNSNIK